MYQAYKSTIMEIKESRILGRSGKMLLLPKWKLNLAEPWFGKLFLSFIVLLFHFLAKEREISMP